MDAISPARPANPGAYMQVFFDAIAANEVERAGAILAENVLLLLPGRPPVHGRRRAIRLMRLVRRRFVEVGWSPAGMLDAEPGWLISTWTMTGTLVTGDVFRREVASVARLDVDGRIAYLSDYLKSPTSLRADAARLGRSAPHTSQ